MRDTELAIIGGLLTDQTVISQIYTIIEPKMFRDVVLGKVYAEIQKAYDNGLNADLPYYVQEVCATNLFKPDLVMKALRDAISTNVSPQMVKSDAQALVKDYMTRQFNKLIGDIRPDAANIESQIAETMDALARIRVTQGKENRNLADVTERYESEYFKDREDQEIHIGFSQIDDLLGSLEGGDIILIGARPAVGKSAFATQISDNLGKTGKVIAYFNLEMSEKQVYERFIVNESGIGLTRLKRATSFLNDEEQRFRKANQALRERKNIVISTGSKTVGEIRAESKVIDPDVIVVDYMQLLRPESNYHGNRYAEVGAISHSLKALAMELNIPVIVLAQLNRRSEGTDTREPSMAEFRESGDCEQDASQVILLWNKDENDRSLKGCKVEKNRQGKTGKVDLRFDGDLMRFVEYGGAQGNNGCTGNCNLSNIFRNCTEEELAELPFNVE